ncbi:MAG: sugar transferase, partial [Pseudomonadota bacterium]
MDVVIGSAVVGFAIAVVLAPYLADIVSVGRGQKSAANSLDTIAKGVDDGVDFTVLRRASLDGTVDIGRVSNRDFSRIDALSPVSGKGAVKRFFDIAAAIALLIATAPLLVVVAAAIRIDSAGPALYRQRRVGINGSV